MIEFKLPSLGSDMDQGKLLEWKIKPGDVVKRGQVVAVVDTSKAAIEVESWQEGTVYRLLVQPDETVPVGTPMALFLAPGESTPTESAMTPAPLAPKVAAPPHIPAVSNVQPPAASAERPKISPAARKRATELNVAIADIATASGPHHSITVEDVERAAQRPASSAAAPTVATDRAAEMRRTIAAAMSRSKREIPHYYLAETIPLAVATDWLRTENARRPMDRRLLMAVLFLKASALALKKYPEFNGYYRDGAFQPGSGVHVGVAIALRQGGLIAPAIHDVDTLTLGELMSRLDDLIQRARAGTLRSSELSDATATVTSLGERGVALVQGVIYPPQVALIGFGRVHERAWAQDGALRALPAVTATLSADHRVSNGHRGALFLATLRDLLQQPLHLSEMA